MVAMWIVDAVAHNNRYTYRAVDLLVCVQIYFWKVGILSELAIGQWIFEPALQFIDWSGNDGHNQPKQKQIHRLILSKR